MTREFQEFAPRDWKPASAEDAAAIGRDFWLRGIAFATPDGRRIDPLYRPHIGDT